MLRRKWTSGPKGSGPARSAVTTTFSEGVEAMIKIAAFMMLAGSLVLGLSTIYANTFAYLATVFPG
jgi:hypothetical protein